MRKADPTSSVRTYRVKDNLWWAAGLFAMGFFFEAAALVKNLDEADGAAVAAVSLGLIALICSRIVLARVKVSPAGIVVINFLLAQRIPWQNIERFELVKRSIGIVCKVVHTDGSHRYIWSITERFWEPNGEGEELTAELNRELAHHTGRSEAGLPVIPDEAPAENSRARRKTSGFPDRSEGRDARVEQDPLA